MSDLGRYTLKLLQRSTPRYKSLQSFIGSDPEISHRFTEFKRNSTIEKQHFQIKTKRFSRKPTLTPNPDAYFRFLEALYPLNNKKVDLNRIEMLIKNGSIMIQNTHPRHWNELLEQLVQSSGNYRSKNYYLFHRVMKDMKELGVPISTKELNTLVYLENYTTRQKLEMSKSSYVSLKERRMLRQFELVTEQFSDSLDISTINIFLKFAILFRSEELLTKISDKLNEKEADLKLDRLSYELLLYHFGYNHKDLDKSLQILQVMDENYIKLDISFINLIIKILIHNEEIESAQEIVEHVFNRYRNLREPLFKRVNTEDLDPVIKDSHTRRLHIVQMKFIDSLQLVGPSNQIVAELIPNFNTLSDLFKYYSQTSNYQIFELLKLLKTANHYEIPVTYNSVVSIINNFRQFDVFGSTETNLLTSEIEEFELPEAEKKKVKIMIQEVKERNYRLETKRMLESKKSSFFNSSADYYPSFSVEPYLEDQMEELVLSTSKKP